MSIFTTIWGWLGGITSQRNQGVQYTAPAYSEEAASTVTEESALQISAVWACVKLIAETVASLPKNVYKITEDGPVIDDTFWFAKLMKRKPNRYQTNVEFWETMLLNLLLHGNCYAKITRMGGQIRSILPLMASQMQTVLLADGSVVYTYTSDGNVDVYSSDSIWHVKLFGNGIMGKSPLAFGRNIVGIAQAAEKAVTKIYANGGKPSGVLSLDRLLTPEQRTSIRANFSTLTTGTDDRLLVLENGMKFDAISMSPQDIELLASRKYELEEICRWFGVPSVLVNDKSGSTTWGSGIEQIVSGFYKLNLRPYLERFECSISVHLFTEKEAQDYYFEFDFEGLLRSDFKTRMEAIGAAIQKSVLTPNEGRAREGLPKIDGGDSLLAQVNMVPIEKLGTFQQGASNATQTDQP